MPVDSTPPPKAPALRGGRLTIERRGGIAGLKASGGCDVDRLAEPDRHALAALLAAPPPDRPSAPTRGLPVPADRFRYHLCYTAPDGSTIACEVGDTELPDSLADLCRPRL